MMRRLLAMLLFLPQSCAGPPPAVALPAPHRGPLRPHPLDEALREPPMKVTVTGKTKVYLDGKRCGMGDIPAGAEVTVLELDADGRTALKIEFRSAPGGK